MPVLSEIIYCERERLVVVTQTDFLFHRILTWMQNVPVRESVRRIISKHRMPRIAIRAFQLCHESLDSPVLNGELNTCSILLVKALVVRDYSQIVTRFAGESSSEFRALAFIAAGCDCSPGLQTRQLPPMPRGFAYRVAAP